MRGLLKFGFLLWMFAGVVGFPASVGWFLYRWQKYGKAVTDKEKLEQRARIRTASVGMLIFLIILIGLIVMLATMTKGEAGKPLTTP